MLAISVLSTVTYILVNHYGRGRCDNVILDASNLVYSGDEHKLYKQRPTIKKFGQVDPVYKTKILEKTNIDKNTKILVT